MTRPPIDRDITDADRQGPTLNEGYNWLLRMWAHSEGRSSHDPVEPECETCGCDMTGQQVYGTWTSWLCGTCIEEDEDIPVC